jgi:hypothetical protein
MNTGCLWMQQFVGKAGHELARAATMRRDIAAPAPKYCLAALIQGVAVAVSHHLIEQALDCPYIGHQSVELRKLSLRQLLPAF